MDAGTQARTVACTNMNATSSRAHTIFQIVLTQTKLDLEAGKATDKVRGWRGAVSVLPRRPAHGVAGRRR